VTASAVERASITTSVEAPLADAAKQTALVTSDLAADARIKRAKSLFLSAQAASIARR
jgi:hypothetical protein